MKCQSGFSFLEILIALVLVVVTGAGVYTLTADIQAKQHNVRLAEGAMHLASAQLAHWRLMNTGASCNGSKSGNIVLGSLAQCLINTEGTVYELDVSETKNILSNSDGVYAKKLTLLVRWQDSRARKQTMSFYFTGSTLRNQAP
ncbi:MULTISPECIES: type II secretion system protein [unclassified Salinivibrio]|uniref:type II secretion system protein n=1 Tax=unclassified Salinivibrio TaxID=2636825 RepID=UPI00128E1215|nr:MULTISPECIES: type II secretion system protein [unclassified Salinivibrio]MPS33512.1 prepilin-type N-terminal cleavage/methylation domain-containing protein [Salinivibrio sp. VYel7]MPX94896.1 prepilin-type N-terminal cleavage/methylation domain-containing protein [Salinivibrio sp. VYel9]MPX97896.1 prepilin-type N-terminal cleavage/methylation domain-containing protein [Salinivibrio sp. VYel6]MPY01126.1 prepilin-type N-terminal cleavage/methylation domain-containing protein [Salinivibrio sp. 